MESFLSINLGNIATIVSFLVGGIVFVQTMRSDLNMQAQRMDLLHQQNSLRLSNLETEIRTLRDVIVETARQKSELFALSERLGLFERRFDKVLDHVSGSSKD